MIPDMECQYCGYTAPQSEFFVEPQYRKFLRRKDEFVCPECERNPIKLRKRTFSPLKAANKQLLNAARKAQREGYEALCLDCYCGFNPRYTHCPHNKEATKKG